MTNEVVLYGQRDIMASSAVDSALDAWKEDMARSVASNELAEASARTYAQGMGRFLRWYTSQSEHSALSPECLRAWRAELFSQGLATATVNTLYGGVRRFCVWAEAHGILPYNPTEAIHARAGSKQHRRDPLTDAEVLRVLAVPGPQSEGGLRDRAILHLMAYVGLRTIEVARATVGDLRSRRHLALAVHGKGHAEADALLYLVHPDVEQTLYDWLAAHPRGEIPTAPLFCSLANRNYGQSLTTRTIRRIVKDAYRRAGIRDPRKTTHSLRHTLVTNLIRQGLPLPKIMSVTRHQRADTLMIYAHEVGRDEDPAEGYVNYGK